MSGERVTLRCPRHHINLVAKRRWVCCPQCSYKEPVPADIRRLRERKLGMTDYIPGLEPPEENLDALS